MAEQAGPMLAGSWQQHAEQVQAAAHDKMRVHALSSESQMWALATGHAVLHPGEAYR